MIPDEAVEAAARVLALDQKAAHWFSDQEWDGIIPDRYKEPYRRQARAALEAAAPHMTERAYNAGHLDGMNGAPNFNPYRKATK